MIAAASAGLSARCLDTATYRRCAYVFAALTHVTTDFFTSPACRATYRAFFTAMLTRVNSVTGVAYRDDSTIFAWELINEPRNAQDRSGNVIQARCALCCHGMSCVDACA